MGLRSHGAITGYHSATDGCPEEENLEHTPRQAASHAQGSEGAVEQLPTLPQPSPASSGLQSLRHLRWA